MARNLTMHPLQRFPSPSPSVSLLIHSLGLLSFSASFYCLHGIDLPLATAYGWYFQFFTIIGLAASLLSFSLALAADLTSSRALFRAKNAISVAATPIETLVTVLYWGICAVDPSLIAPQDVGELPLVLDLGLHAAPAAFLVVDLLLLSPPWTISTGGSAALASGMTVAYWLWVEHCYSHNGWYPYPLFEVISTWQRAAFFGFSAILATASIKAMKWVYAFVNGSEDAPRKGKKLQ